MGERRIRSLAVPAAALAATCLFFHRAAFGSGTFIARDILHVYLPLHHYWVERVTHGGFPRWYPFDGMGEPFVPMLISSALHPSNLIFLALPLGIAMKWTILLSYAAALWGTVCLLHGYGLSRSACALGAVGYALSGYPVAMSNNTSYLMALATYPWLFHAASRLFKAPSLGRLSLTALALSGVLFAGDAQGFVVAAAGVVVQAAMERGQLRRRLLLAGAVLALSALLGAAQLIPSLQVQSEALGAKNTEEKALHWSGHPVRALELMLGPLWLKPSGEEFLSSDLAQAFWPGVDNAWADSMHLGAVFLVLAAAGLWTRRRSRGALGLVGLFAVLTALWLGRHAGLYGFFHRHLFAWHAFRYPEKLTPFLLLLLCAAAALGFDAAQKDAVLRRRVILGLAGGALFSAVLILAEQGAQLFSVGFLSHLWPTLPQAQLRVLGERFIRANGATGVTLGLGAAALRVTRAQWGDAALVLVCAVNLYLSNGNLAWVGNPEVLTREPALLARAELEDGPALGRYRVAGYALNAPPRATGSTVPLADHRAAFQAEGLRSPIPGLWNVEAQEAYLPAATGRLAALRPFGDAGRLNTRYLVLNAANAGRLGVRGDEVAGGVPGTGLAFVRAREFLPRVYLASPRCAVSSDEAARTFHDTSFRPGEEAVVECGNFRPPPRGLPWGESVGFATLLRYEPEFVEVSVDAREDTLLVLNDAFYSGWSVTVDDRPSQVLATNVAVRGVPVHAGRHRVHFRYTSPGFLLGCGLSLFTALALAVGCRWTRFPPSLPT